MGASHAPAAGRAGVTSSTRRARVSRSACARAPAGGRARRGPVNARPHRGTARSVPPGSPGSAAAAQRGGRASASPSRAPAASWVADAGGAAADRLRQSQTLTHGAVGGRGLRGRGHRPAGRLAGRGAGEGELGPDSPGTGGGIGGGMPAGAGASRRAAAGASQEWVGVCGSLRRALGGPESGFKTGGPSLTRRPVGSTPMRLRQIADDLLRSPDGLRAGAQPAPIPLTGSPPPPRGPFAVRSGARPRRAPAGGAIPGTGG